MNQTPYLQPDKIDPVGVSFDKNELFNQCFCPDFDEHGVKFVIEEQDDD